MRLFFKVFFRTLHILLGPVLLIWDMLTTPKGIERPAEDQERIDEQTKNLALYQFRTCPFCIKTRRAIKRLSLNIDVLDAQHDMKSRDELLHGGGQVKVPCLKITDENNKTTWMYESSDIIAYLQQRFA